MLLPLLWQHRFQTQRFKEDYSGEKRFWVKLERLEGEATQFLTGVFVPREEGRRPATGAPASRHRSTRYWCRRPSQSCLCTRNLPEHFLQGTHDSTRKHNYPTKELRFRMVMMQRSL